MSTIRTRRNALKMATWDPALLWYAKAVGAMQARALADPTSWMYQAAIHGYTEDPSDPGSAIWKQWAAGQTLPTVPQRRAFWGQCQHGSWYFLPWHRLYLGYFESIVAKTVAGLGGPADWSLPYWNYNDGPASGKLPDAFAQAKLPDGSQNPLFVPVRKHGNDGKVFLDQKKDVSLKEPFGDHDFVGANSQAGGKPGFGGVKTPFQHNSRGGDGALEYSPHDLVHSRIGGWMGDPTTAGRDPIFWLHHANIDRLWVMWLKADAANKNPTAADKWTLAFSFNDGAGNTPSHQPLDVLDPTAAPFYYQYEDVTLPPGTIVAPPAAPQPLLAEQAFMAEKPIPEMVGASSQPTRLDQPTTMRVDLFPVSGALKMLGAETSHFRRAFLHLENVRGKGQPSVCDVYLNVPVGTAQPPEELYVGSIPSFGLEQASAGTERHAGSGLKYSFDITRTANLLMSQGKWDHKTLNVLVVPREAHPNDTFIEIGRVSLYFN